MEIDISKKGAIQVDHGNEICVTTSNFFRFGRRYI